MSAVTPGALVCVEDVTPRRRNAEPTSHRLCMRCKPSFGYSHPRHALQFLCRQTRQPLAIIAVKSSQLTAYHFGALMRPTVLQYTVPSNYNYTSGIHTTFFGRVFGKAYDGITHRGTHSATRHRPFKQLSWIELKPSGQSGSTPVACRCSRHIRKRPDEFNWLRPPFQVPYTTWCCYTNRVKTISQDATRFENGLRPILSKGHTSFSCRLSFLTYGTNPKSGASTQNILQKRPACSTTHRAFPRFVIPLTTHLLGMQIAITSTKD